MLPRSLYSFGVATRPALGIWHEIPGCESQARYCSENFTQPIRFVPTSGVPAEKGCQGCSASESRIRESAEILCSNILQVHDSLDLELVNSKLIHRSSRWRSPS